MNVREIEEAVYTINRAAKRLKHIRYKTGYAKSKCSADKLLRRQESLYELKNQIISKALLEGDAREEGIHRFKNDIGNEINFKFVRFINRSFHVPIESIECGSMNVLGNYEYRPYKHNDQSNGLTAVNAKKVLHKYLF